MLKLKNFLNISLAVSLLLSASMLLASCNGDKTSQTTTTESSGEQIPESNKADYKISVVDHTGNPVNDVIVNVLQNGENKGMKVVVGGSVTFNLDKGNYNVELGFPDANASYYYDKESCTLTSDVTELTVSLYLKPTHSQQIYAYSESAKDHIANTAYSLSEGGFYVDLTGGRTYFLFAPQRGGTYKVDYIADAELVLGYYGGTFNVLPENQAKKEGNAIILDVQNSMVGGVWVIGVDSEKAGNCVLTINRTGEPQYLIQNEPWIPYTENNVIDFYEICENWKATGFEYIDLTDKSLKVVLNEDDGYYHLNSVDGPIVYIAMDKDSKYISSIKTICENQRMGVYIYDDEGNFVRKESYNELFAQYSFGTVPLTEKLAYAVKSHGEVNKWWNFTTEQHIFGDDFAKIVVENAWLFACGTFSSDESNDNGIESSPIAVPEIIESDENPAEPVKVRIEAGQTYHFTLDATSGRKLTVSGLNSEMKIIYDGQEYSASGRTLDINLKGDVKSFTVIGEDGAEIDYVTFAVYVISNS